MLLQSVLVADIAGMDDKGDFLVGGVIADVVRPAFLIVGVEYLGVGDVDELVASVLPDASFPGLQPEVVGLFFPADPPVIPVIRLIA